MKWVESGGKYIFVWDGDDREPVITGVLRRLKLLESKFYPCELCKKNYVCKFQGIPCGDCLHSKEYQKQVKDLSGGVRTKQYKDAVAFGNDATTGQPLAINSKGEKFDPKETIYGKFKNDPNGWKAVGKKVTDPEYGKRKL